jgi:hypothetical protein
VTVMGVRVLRTPAQAPRANAYCERLHGTLRRECLDLLIPFGEEHLRRAVHWKRHHRHRHFSAGRAPAAPRSAWALGSGGQTITPALGRSGWGTVEAVSRSRERSAAAGWMGLSLGPPGHPEAVRRQRTATRFLCQAEIAPDSPGDAQLQLRVGRSLPCPRLASRGGLSRQILGGSVSGWLLRPNPSRVTTSSLRAGSTSGSR